MSSNKDLVSKSKDILNAYGYDVKTSHLYELFSKLSNEPSWNVASSKNLSFFSKLFKKKENCSPFHHSIDMDKFKNQLDSGLFRDHFYAGNDIENKPFIMGEHSNSLFVGGMGSGRIIGLLNTLLSSLLANSNNTMIFLIDPAKGAYDYKSIWNVSQVVKVAGESDDHLDTITKKIEKALTLLYTEYEYRVSRFKSQNAKDLPHYQSKTKENLTRLIIAIDETSLLCKLLNFEVDHLKKGTLAFKLLTLLKDGQKYGIKVLAVNVNAVDLSDKFIECFDYINAFKCNEVDSKKLFGDERASTIRTDQKGHCYRGDDEIQYPYIDSDQVIELISQYVKDLKSSNLYMDRYNIKNWIKLD